MRLLKRLLQIQRGEAALAGLMTAYFFLAMASVSIVKSLQSALYLGRVGFDYRLPLIYFALAIASSPAVLLYRWLGKRFSATWVNSLTLLWLISSLLILSMLSGAGYEWAYPLFYLWAGIFSVLLPMLGWVMSYSFFDTREAKRLFSLLGTGGILGGIIGGYYTAAAAEVGSEALMLHVCLLLGAMLGLLALLPFYAERRKKRPLIGSTTSKESSLRAMLRSDYLRTLALMVLITGLVTTVIDLEFKWVLEKRFDSEADLTRFVGAFLGTAFVLSALFQLFATNRVLRRFGAGAGLLVLPSALLVGSAGILFLPVFWATVTLRFLDGGLRNSIFRTSAEIIFIPLSGPQTVAAKSFVDLVAFRSGDAVGAAFFLAAVLVADAAPGTVLLSMAVALIGWMALSIRLREGYLRALKRSIQLKADSAGRRAFEIDEAVAEQTLLEALHSRNPAKVHFALHRLLERPEEVAAIEGFGGSGEAMMQGTLYRSKPPEWLKSAAPLVDHPDRRVAAAAFALMTRYGSRAHRERFQSAMEGEEAPEPVVLDYLNRYSKDPRKYLEASKVLAWSRRVEGHRVVAIVRLMGKTGDPSYRDSLVEWARESNGPRAKAAIRALGSFYDPSLVGLLVSRLSESWSRESAKRALVRYGDQVVDELRQVLRRSEADLTVRREIPFILTQINTQEARAGLVAALYLPDATISYRALKGLNQIRDYSDLSYDQSAFLPVLQLWAKQYYELLNIQLLLDRSDRPGVRLLAAAVGERMDWTLEKIFRALGLFFPAGDAYYSYLGYISNERELRANAVELIESRMPAELKKTLLPIFTSRRRKEAASVGRRIFGLPGDLKEIVREILFQRDPWLKCCVLAAAADFERSDLENAVQQAAQDVHPLVRETAAWVFRAWESRGQIGQAAN